MNVVNINGVTYNVPDGASISVGDDGVLMVNGSPFGEKQTDPTVKLVVVEGRLGSIKTNRANVQCGNVEGDVDAGGNVTCAEVKGKVDAGGNVNCGNVGSGVDSGGNVVCGNVGGSVDASGNVTCEDVKGGVDAGGNIRRR